MLDESIVLVITPSPYMTNKIQQSLDEIGGYKVINSKSPAEALDLATRIILHVCILDIFHPDFPTLKIVEDLYSKHPDLKLILILSDQDHIPKDIPGVTPDGFLYRSFVPEQLKSALGYNQNKQESLIPYTPSQGYRNPDLNSEGSSQDPFPTRYPPLHRPADFFILNKQLTDLSVDTIALAIIVLHRKQLLTYKGVMPYPSVQEITDLINRYSKTSPQYLQKEVLLGVQKSGNGDMIRFIELQSIQGKFILYVISLTKERMLALVFNQDTRFNKIRLETRQITKKLIETQFETTTVSISSDTELLEPQKRDGGSNLPPSIPHLEPIVEDKFVESIPSVQSIEKGYVEGHELDDQTAGEPLSIDLKGNESADHAVSLNEARSGFSPTSYGHYITYSCLLIPRMPQHLLTSNLASYLFKWMGQLCLAYGWRLEHLSIHPNHIQIVTGASLTNSPAYIVRTLRNKTSQYIFNHFPPLTDENPSGDFWAPGFFISGGRQTIQPHLINQYINEIREHQGVHQSTISS
jgi:DNA-binding NarL/FixJ family response regulator/REP element-mobilizing transposase RayT